MNKAMLLQLLQVEHLSNGSKLTRFLHHPLKYSYAIFFRHVLYKMTKREVIKRARLFYGREMYVALPASTDIYLTGGKSHPSETRLAKYLIRTLQAGDVFIDVGAHYGYYALLAAILVADTGKVYAFEPAAKSFAILQRNTQILKNVSIFNQALHDEIASLQFFEFPNLYSEYNTFTPGQFSKAGWFHNNQPRPTMVNATTIDAFTAGNAFTPNIIKIDVEGAEYNVLQGAKTLLTNSNAIIVMEYVNSNRGNEAHAKAYELLKEKGYDAYIINDEGALQNIENIEAYLTQKHIESDNLVFKKQSM